MSSFPSGWLKGRWGWLVIWTTAFVVCALVALICHLAELHPWSDVSADRIAWYHREECENVDTKGFFLQLLNFWSNFAYLATGLMILCLNEKPLGRFVGIVFLFLAVGSGWFHGTLSEFGQTVDIAGVYVALLAIAFYGFVEMVPLEHTDPKVWILMGGAVVLGVVGAFVRGNVHFFDSDYFTPMLVFIILVYMVSSAFRYPGPNQANLLLPGLGALVLGLAALVFKFTDGDDNALADNGKVYAKCLYGPESPIQGHAIWHSLSALMFLCMFEFFRSLKGRSQSVFPWRTTA